MTDVPDLVHKRAPVLRALCEGAETKPEVGDATECSRSTIDRAVEELIDAELVERRGGHYYCTGAAARILESYDTFRAEAGIYYDRRDAIAALPRDADLPVAVLENARIAAPDPNMPDRALEVALQGLEDADRIYALVPWMLSIYDRFFNRAVLEHGLEIDVVYTRDVVEHIADLYHDRFEDLLESGRVDAYVVDELPRYTISVIEGIDSTETGVRLDVMYFTDEEIQSVLQNSSEDAFEWGRDCFQEHRERADPIEEHWD